MLAAGKLSGELFERIGQPPVLGELVVGILLGSSVLGLIPTTAADPLTTTFALLAEVGVVVLLFEIGLETNLTAMMRVGGAASAVAVVGVAVPFALGALYWVSPLHSYQQSQADLATTAVFVGAMLTATSVGITARVLADLHCLRTVEARLIIGAAVIDDVLGLVILGVVTGFTSGAAISTLGVARLFALGVGFLVVAVAIGLALAPRVFGVIERLRVRGVLVVSAFAFLLLLAALADRAGSALIIGAFAAGIIVAGTNQAALIGQQMKPVADIFVPIFFLSVGAVVDLRVLNPANPENAPLLGIAGVLLVLAVVGKVVAGWAVPWRRFNRFAVGIGMAPRGEVGLIFAGMGLASGVLSRDLYSAILIMVIGTTLVVPPLLGWALRSGGSTPDTA